MGYQYINPWQAKKLGIKTTNYKYKNGSTSSGIWVNIFPNGNTKIVQAGNRIKNSDGSYTQLNSNGTVTKLMDKNGNFNKDYKFRNSDKTNMQNGNVFDSKKWGLDTNSKTKTYIDKKTGRTYFQGKDGKYYSFENGLEQSKDSAQQNEKLKAKLVPRKLSIGEDGLVSVGTNWLLDKLGVQNQTARKAVNLASTFVYMTPFVGTALSAFDAGAAALSGDYGRAASTLALGLLPSGRFIKGLAKTGLKDSLGLYKMMSKTKNPFKIRNEFKQTNRLIRNKAGFQGNGFVNGTKNMLYGGIKSTNGLSKTKNALGTTYAIAKPTVAIGGLVSSSNLNKKKEEERTDNIKNKFLKDNFSYNSIRNFDLDNTNKYILDQDKLNNYDELFNFRNEYIYG